MTSLLLIAGIALFIIGGLMFLVAMFSTSIWWGIGGLVFVPVQIIFVFVHWKAAKRAILVQTVGLLLVLAAVLSGGETFVAEYRQQFSQYMQQNAPAQWAQVQEMQGLLSVSDESVSGISHSIKNAASSVEKNPAVSAAVQAVQSVEDKPVARGDKVIYKCVDAGNHVSYSEQPCVGAKQKAITFKSDYDGTQEKPSPSMFDSARKLVTKDTESLSASFHCDGRTHCSQMTSCEEAQYFLAHCPGVEMDGNHDGVPCEKQWCGKN